MGASCEADDRSCYGDIMGWTVRTVVKTENNLLAYDNTTYQTIPDDGVSGKSEPLAFNGFFTIDVSGDTIDVSYITGKCSSAGCDAGYGQSAGSTVAAESFKLDPDTGEITQSWRSIGPELVNLRATIGTSFGAVSTPVSIQVNSAATAIV